MAVYRQVHISFWQDPDVLDYTPKEKYFYLYLMTNSKTTQCGIYELPVKIIELETGYNRETVEKLLERFTTYKKILYHPPTKEIMILNWMKHNAINSGTVKSCILKELKGVKNKGFIRKFQEVCIRYGYGIDTVSIDLGEEKEKEEEQEKEHEEKNKTSENAGLTETTENQTFVDESDSPKSEPHQPGFSLPSVDNMTEQPTVEQHAEKIPYEKIAEAWNRICVSFPKVEKLSKGRKDKVRARWQELKSLDEFERVFRMMEQSKFLKGDNNNGWKATFDWIMVNDNNYMKVLEGQYADKRGPSKPPSSHSSKRTSFSTEFPPDFQF